MIASRIALNADPPADPPDRFEGAIDLDLSVQDDPESALVQALEAGDTDRALGAYRLMEVAGRTPHLPLRLARSLGARLEQAGMHLEAARVIRQGAEHDLKHPEAPEAVFRAACLLLGPARRPEPGGDMLLYLVANYPDHPRKDLAERIFDCWQEGDRPALAHLLAEAGLGEEADPGGGQAAAGEAPPAEIGPQPSGPLPRAPGGFGGFRRRMADRVQQESWRRWSRVAGVVYLALAGLFALSWFMHDRYKSIDDPHPEVLRQPRQEPAGERAPIRFAHGDYNYSLQPRYRYDIAGLIVGKNDYTMLGLARKNVFLMDLCMIWGSNVSTGNYRHGEVEFVQHGNVCYSRYRAPAWISGTELSNNHVLTGDPDLQDAFDELEAGDQIRMTGYLVDGAAVAREADGPGALVPARLTSSTTRDDRGMGACEIMYVERLEVLARGNPFWRVLYVVGFWLLLFLTIVIAARLLLLPVGRSRQMRSQGI